GTTYFWQVVAHNITATTTGPVWSLTTATDPLPAAPSSPSPADRATNIGTTPMLTWSSAGATSYQVRFGDTVPLPTVAAGLTSPSYQARSPGWPLTYNTTYCWQIVAT